MSLVFGLPDALPCFTSQFVRCWAWVGFCAFCTALISGFHGRLIPQRQTAIVNALPDALDLLVNPPTMLGLTLSMAMQEHYQQWR